MTAQQKKTEDAAATTYPEVRATHNGQAWRFEVPPGRDPILYARDQLAELFGAKADNWGYELIN